MEKRFCEYEVTAKDGTKFSAIIHHQESTAEINAYALEMPLLQQRFPTAKEISFDETYKISTS